MQLRFNIGQIYILLVILFLLQGCDIFRRIQKEDNTEFNMSDAIKTRIKKTSNDKYILIENAKILLETEKKINAKLTFYAERDELMFVSLKYMGFEVIRFMLNRDSVKYINRFSREYLYRKIDEIDNKDFDLFNFEMINNILFTGFDDVENVYTKYYRKRFSMMNDTVQYKNRIDEKRTFIANYTFPELTPESYIFRDLDIPGKIFVNLDRDNKQIKRLESKVLWDELNAYVKIEIGFIEKKEYNKTIFKIGRNYNEIQTIF